MTNFINNIPSHFSGKQARLAGSEVVKTPEVRILWTLILHEQSSFYYGVLPTHRMFHPFLQSVALDYLDDSQEHQHRKAAFSKAGIEALSDDALYRKVVPDMGNFITVGSSNLHDKVVSSKRGFIGAMEASKS